MKLMLYTKKDCPFCTKTKSQFDKILRHFDKYKIKMTQIDQSSLTAQEKRDIGIRLYPTIVLEDDDGKRLGILHGAWDDKKLVAFLNTAINTSDILDRNKD